MVVISGTILVGVLLAAVAWRTSIGTGTPPPHRKQGPSHALPAPKSASGLALTKAMARRRSVREFVAKSLSREHVAQLCWAAQGITDEAAGRRTAPSAGAHYPLSVFVVDASGVTEYEPRSHSLREVLSGDLRGRLRSAAYDQSCVGDTPACFVIVMDVGLTAAKYGRRAERYCLLEAGHAAQNFLLQAVALDLGAVPVGAFDDDQVSGLLRLPGNLRPVYLIPVGHPAGE